MKHPWILHTLIRTLVPAAVLCFSVSWAQQPSTGPHATAPGAPLQPLAPLPDGRASGGSPVTSEANSDQPQADTHVLSDAETLGLGSLRHLRHMFNPALQVSEFGETGIVAGETVSASSLGGSLDVDRHWSRYDLTIAYRGAETIYQPSYYYGIHNLPYQDGIISEEMLSGRWTLRLRDDVSYSWGAAFGSLFAGGPAQANQNSSLDSIQPSLASGGTIQTGLAPQLSNIALGEVDYARSRRTTLTFLASYGLQQFVNAGYINSRNVDGRIGYNYALGPKNSVALTFDDNRTAFTGVHSQLQTDLIQIAFGRKVTGRLAFQLSAGPQVLSFENLRPSHTRQLSWSASGSLIYQRNRNGYSLSYFRGITPGSGVFFGSKLDSITATATHEFTRFWSVSVTGGYAANNALVPTLVFANRFDDWFAGASLNRQITRQVQVTLSYALQQQTRGGVCPVLSCALPASFNQFGITLQWRPELIGRIV